MFFWGRVKTHKSPSHVWGCYQQVCNQARVQIRHGGYVTKNEFTHLCHFLCRLNVLGSIDILPLLVICFYSWVDNLCNKNRKEVELGVSYIRCSRSWPSTSFFMSKKVYGPSVYNISKQVRLT